MLVIETMVTAASCCIQS